MISRHQYLRRRRVFRVVFWGSLATISMWAFLSAVRNATSFACSADTVVVGDEAGETLWQIAERHCTGAIDMAVTDMVARYGTIIHRGQVIVLP